VELAFDRRREDYRRLGLGCVVSGGGWREGKRKGVARKAKGNNSVADKKENLGVAIERRKNPTPEGGS